MKKQTLNENWMPGSLLRILLTTLSLVFSDPAVLMAARTSPEVFTRSRKLSFYDLCVCLVASFKGKSNFCMLTDYFTFFKGVDTTVTQQGFSEKRKNIDHTPFKKAFKGTVENVVDFGLRTYMGYVPVAVDGSHLHMPKFWELAAFFGTENSIPTALCMMFYLPLNDLVLDIRLFHINTDERKAFRGMLSDVKRALKGKRALIIGDRGYPSHELFWIMECLGMRYLFRCSKTSTFKEVENAPMGTSVQILRHGRKVKVHKFILPSGEIEVLVTNAFSLNGKAMEELYWMRWTIEGKIEFTKYCVGLERFTGRKVNSVMQDLYCAAIVANLAGAIAMDADRMIRLEMEGKGNKYEYIAKRSEIVGAIHRRFGIILARQMKGEDREEQMRLLFRECAQNRTPIRKGRSFERKLPKQKKYYPDNQRTN